MGIVRRAQRVKNENVTAETLRIYSIRELKKAIQSMTDAELSQTGILGGGGSWH